MLKTVGVNEAKDQIIKYWNQDFFDTFPLDRRLFEQKIINNRFTLFDESFVLFDDDKYLGSIVLKQQVDTLFISLIHVAKSERLKGYGKKLVKHAMTVMQKRQLKDIIIGRDNDCLFSGLFVNNNELTHKFFLDIGFKKNHDNFNLISGSRPGNSISRDGYFVRVVSSDAEKEEVLKLIKQNFSERWHEEVSRSLLEDIYILLHRNKIIGFVNTANPKSPVFSNSMNLYLLFKNLFGMGPLGLDKDYQGQGLGTYLVNVTLKDLFDRGASEVMVDWTGLVDFYKKCGFERIFSKYTIYSYEKEV
jgi:GNAT superfamily N-acetyltransferase